jgi:hypothetical protein
MPSGEADGLFLRDDAARLEDGRKHQIAGGEGR